MNAAARSARPYTDAATEAAALLRSIKGFETRAAELEHQALRGEAALAVAVVGSTSSGKSALVNALMGEALLPEQAKATTNLLVRCRRGEPRSVEILHRGGRVERLSDGEVTAEVFGAYGSEDGNPRNTKGVECLTWTSPRSALSPGVVLYDTPGLNAYGHEQHDELTLERYLQLADVVLYVSSVRSPLGRADLDAAQAILENDQRVLFVLTHADLESDSFEGGRLLKSREQKLKGRVRALRAAADEAGLANAVLDYCVVSSTEGKVAAGDTYSDAWRRSGLADLVAHLAKSERAWRVRLVEKRGKTLEASLDAAIRDLQRLCNETLPVGDAPAAASEQPEIVLLQDGLARARGTVEAVQERWRPELDSEAAFRTFLRGVARNESLQALVPELLRDWTTKQDRINGALSVARREASEHLRAATVAWNMPEERSTTVVSVDFPQLAEYGRSEAYNVRKRGWFDALLGRTEERVRTVYEMERLSADLKQALDEVAAAGAAKLTWWSQWMEETLLGPAAHALSKLEAIDSELEEARRSVSAEREARLQVLITLRRLRRAIDPVRGEGDL